MSEPLLQVRDIVKTFDGVKALDDINLVVGPSKYVGLCGKNDVGESTLMKVLSGVYPNGAWDGEILWKGQPLRTGGIRDTGHAGIVIAHQELILVPELPVAENIYLSNEITLPGGRMNYATIYQGADKLLHNLNIQGINAALPVMHYGGGHQQPIGIAKVPNKRAKLLILDEPSLSLTTVEMHILLDVARDLKAHGIACVYISHRLDEVETMYDTITIIHDDRHVATAPMDALTTDRIITQVAGRGITQLFPCEPHLIGETVFEIRNVTCYDANDPARKRIGDVSFPVRCGKILGVAGSVGAGRTGLIQAVFGTYEGASEVELVLDRKPLKARAPLGAIRVGTAIVPEDHKRYGIVSLMNARHNITLTVLQRFARLGRVDGVAELDTIRKEMQRPAMRATHPILPIASLSGGSQQKTVFTRMLLTEPRVLVLDEPTRDMNVGAECKIYELIDDFTRHSVAIVMISSELPKVLGISDHVSVIGEGQLRGDFVNDGLTQEHILTAAIQPVRSPPRHTATFYQAGHA